MGQTVIFYDESTAFGNSQASAYEETTANISNRRTSAASRGKDTAGNGVPPQVIFCQVTKEVQFSYCQDRRRKCRRHFSCYYCAQKTYREDDIDGNGIALKIQRVP